MRKKINGRVLCSIGISISLIFAVLLSSSSTPASGVDTDKLLTMFFRQNGVEETGTVSAVFMGQSEVGYILSSDPYYQTIAQPEMTDGSNLSVFSYSSTPQKTIVDQTSVTAGTVNPAMAAMSEFLKFARPGYSFILGDASQGGTSRLQLGDDAESGRQFATTAAVIGAVEAENGGPLDVLVEDWYNSDAPYLGIFPRAYWPLYFGTNSVGVEFTLGSINGYITTDVDRCFWDGMAITGSKGRGILARGVTKWTILTPMPYLDAPVAPTAEWTSYGGTTVPEPSRLVMDSLVDNVLAESVGLSVGPSSHICKFGGESTQEHPDISDPDGQILFMWPFAIALYNQTGRTIQEPKIIDIEGASDGTYADLVVSLPNGGNLTTLRALRSESAPGVEPPHYQPVVGIEINRDGTRRPVYKTTETSYDVNYRGTVSIIDSGSGTPRKGRVRVTPEVPFSYGDSFWYLKGNATATLLENRDLTAELYKNFLIEHIPSLYDSTATYPFPGVAVRPLQSDLYYVPVGERSKFVNVTSFAGADGEELTTSNPDWIKHSSYTGQLLVSNNRLYQPSTTNALYYHTATPTSISQDIRADIILPEYTTDWTGINLCARVSTTNNTMFIANLYHINYQAELSIQKIENGTITTIGSVGNLSALKRDIPHNIRFTVSGTSPNINVALYVNGEKITSSSSVSATGLDTTGKVGIRFRSFETPTSTKGIHAINFTAE